MAKKCIQKWVIAILLFGLFYLPTTTFSQSKKLKSLKKEVVQEIDTMKEFTQQMVDMIFSFGELGFQEFETSKYITGILRENGFEVQEGISGMPTAWWAKWGSG
ncbi:MAG: amidohydrolase, partial [bacterium]